MVWVGTISNMIECISILVIMLVIGMINLYILIREDLRNEHK